MKDERGAKAAPRDLPAPEFSSQGGWFEITFLRDPFTEERLREMGLNERQVHAVKWVKEKGKITNEMYREVCSTSERTATRDLAALVSVGVFEQIGITGKGTEYILRRHKDAKDAT